MILSLCDGNSEFIITNERVDWCFWNTTQLAVWRMHWQGTKGKNESTLILGIHANIISKSF